AAGYRHVAATREGDSWRHLIVHTADPVQARRHGTVDELRRLLTALGVAAGASSSPAAPHQQDAGRATGTPRQQVPADWPELPVGLLYAHHRNVPADAARPQAHIFRPAPLSRSPKRHEPLCDRQAITTQPPAPDFAHPGLRLCSECRRALRTVVTAAMRRAAEVEQAALPVEGEQPGVVAEVEQPGVVAEGEQPGVVAEAEYVAQRPAVPVALSPNQQRPIVPRVLFIELQRHPWQLGTLHFWSTCYATATTVRCQQPDGQLITKHHHQLYCLPDEAAELAVQAAYQALQEALDTLAAALRPLRYADQLAAAGGIDLAPNPLCEWVVFVDDPGTYVRPNWFYSERVPTPVRQPITRHTAHMLNLAGQDSAVPQHKRFRCDDDATWSHIQGLHQAALAAEAVWQQMLTNLGTYAVALADRRYQAHEQSAAGEQQNDAGTTLPAFPQLPSRPALAAAGWTWEDHPRMKRRRLVGHRMATDWHRLVQDAVDEARALHQEPAGVAAAAGRLRAQGWMLFQTGANWRLWAEGVAEPVVLLTDAGLLL
ncbi:MAG TPA: hypothetical protein VFS21_07090, partial [Roseiflexaceae bacterium]|nr:hypothetical protein [Roseiflexaceae bacterium]